VDKSRSPNDLGAPVPKFCLTVESFRRTVDGRVRTPQEFMQQFFPWDGKGSNDRIFKYLPNEVRGPILTAWGLRGAKSALKDTDEKVQAVVYDALLAGDIDHEAFEDALVPEMVVRWAPLADWWSFWRAGKLSKQAILKALESAYDLGLFDAKWFFETIETNGGKLRGTDVVSEGLTKAELTEWIRKVHASGDGSPRGLVAAIGWERIVGKTPNDVLIRVLDALAAKVALVSTAANGSATAGADASIPEDERPSTRITPAPPAPDETTKVDALSAARMRSVPPPLPADLVKAVSTPPGSTGEDKLDSLFGDDSDPPASTSDDSIAVVLEEESPTSPPPALPPATEEATNVSTKGRGSFPSPPGFRGRGR
jgi:hypothetical protein